MLVSLLRVLESPEKQKKTCVYARRVVTTDEQTYLSKHLGAISPKPHGRGPRKCVNNITLCACI